MNKPELITLIARDNGCTKLEAKHIIECFTYSVSHALEDGESVNLSGFGNFTLVERAAKKYRHPLTGKIDEMPATHRIKFVPAAQLADAVK